ncbi:hypothetical protein [Bacillus pseudomycoides]|uniref:hypothetical protein n=1 Tax=Bacillus pseudomycoides TaxID=64104 RepID=UPI000BF23BA7|nr:hypothetical protein [Bacillus pseudomycoides]PEN09705.1 hypothetical protein CN640_11700 [Bacillus pseudomycoides]
MSRKVSNLFPGSATRTNENEEQIKSKQQQNDNVNSNVNGNVNDDVNGNKNINDNNDVDKGKQKANEDILELLKENNDKKVVGFHLDKDIRDAFQKVLGKKPPRGAQSKLANKIFRDFFEERGLL